MFPFVCLATMPLFCGFNWPRRFFLMQVNRFKFLVENEPVKNPVCYYEEDDKNGKWHPYFLVLISKILISIIMFYECMLYIYEH